MEYFSLEKTFKIIELGVKADKLLSIQALFRAVRGSAMQELSNVSLFNRDFVMPHFAGISPVLHHLERFGKSLTEW